MCRRTGKSSKNATRIHRQLHAVSGGSSLSCSITEVNRTVPKAAFRQKLELQSHVVGQCGFAASHDDRDQEQMNLVEQPGPEGVVGELRTPDQDVMLAGRFQLPD